MRAAMSYALEQTKAPRSPLYRRIDANRVAAVGHSRGAVGAVNLTTSAGESAGSLIKTTVLLNLPVPSMVHPGEQFRLDLLRQPVLLLGSSDDQISTVQNLQAAYAAISAPAALAVRIGAQHSSAQHDGAAFLGYVTAWLEYRLLGDASAKLAFAGASPQLLTDTGWQDRAAKGLN